MKTPPLNLLEVISNTVSELYATEKKYLKTFEQLADASHTDELRAALSPAGTEIENHISRLSQIMDLLKLKPSRISAEIGEELMKMAKEVSGFKKQQSVIKDIQLLQCAKMIILVKIGVYESLHFIASTRKMEAAALLLEQTLSDNKNTAAYLCQIEQNILYPQAAKAE
ncbi:ferritin-like metal-binding protein YciE [Pedobacter sp. UYP24]